MRLLGIDPGLRFTGYACVEPAPASRGRTNRAGSEAALIEAGVIRLKPRASVSARLAELDQDLAGIIDRLHAEVVAVERLYAHYKHPTTAIIMGHARGVVL